MANITQLRKTTATLFATIALLCAPISAMAEAALWQEIRASEVPNRGASLPEPLRFRALGLDYVGMRGYLAQAPLEADAGRPVCGLSRGGSADHGKQARQQVSHAENLPRPGY